MADTQNKLTIDDSKKLVSETVTKITAEYKLDELNDDSAREFLKKIMTATNMLIAKSDLANETVIPLKPIENLFKNEVQVVDNLSKQECISLIKKALAFYNIDSVKAQFAASIFGALPKVPLGPLRGTPSTDLVSELNNIDFKKLIGGPMQAAIQAQADASMTSIAFIKTVGFNNAGDDLNYVDFKYKEKITDPTTGAVTDGPDRTLTVPLLAMLTIPSIRIETLDIDFNVKLNSVETSNVSDEIKVGLEAGGSIYGVTLKVTASYQRSSSSGVKVEKEYTMNVKVKATQDEMPAGLEKILNILSA